MAIVSSQPTRSSCRVANYVQKNPVMVAAIGAPVARFEEHLKANRRRWGKDGYQAKALIDDDGKIIRDAFGQPVPMRTSKGRIVYDAKYVQAHSLVFSYGRDELDPDDPESWDIAMRNTRATIEDLAPDHMALLATEVNGRSGCVHVHAVLDATNANTGRAFDTNLLQHARLAIRHDRVLAEQGFVQREDMCELVTDAKRRMEEARAEVIAEHGGKVTESQLRRKITAAENKVSLTNGEDRELQKAQRPTAHQQREDRRQREYHRYMVNEQDREAARELSVPPEPERFSEVVLESRVRQTLSDPRVQSWEDAAAIGRENRVTIARRGKDVSYGMLLVQPDGTIAEPARAHARRGGLEGSDRGLGDGFRVTDVDAAIARNAQLRKATERHEAERAADQARERSMQERLAAEQAEMERLHEAYPQEMQMATDVLTEDVRRQQPGLSDANVDLLVRAQLMAKAANGTLNDDLQEVRGALTPPAISQHDPEPQEPVSTSEPLEPEPWQSGLRGVRAKGKNSAKVQQRIDGMAQIEEDCRGIEPDAEFERRVNAVGGIGTRFLRDYGEYLDPAMRRQLELRTVASLEGTRNREQAQHVQTTDRRARRLNERSVEIRQLGKEGRYEDAVKATERHAVEDQESQARIAKVKQQIIDDAADLDHGDDNVGFVF